MSCSCGCCDGLHATAPAAIWNRPGLAALRARIGTHASFLETMLARLSSADYPELAALRTRDPADPAIALLDAWATVADVLTFYQERIANEGYLRTATERRSLIELARLIGYVPRPGVASSVYLAFGLEKDAAPVVIPRGTKANSIPNPGETMQAFETSADLLARFEWNAIRPRLVQPHTPQTVLQDGLYLKGTATRLKPGDMLLIGLAGQEPHKPVRIATVEPDAEAKRTRVTLVLTRKQDAPDGGVADGAKDAAPPVLDDASLAALRIQGTRAPRGSAQLARSVGASFGAGADTIPRLLAHFEPALARSLYPALRNAGPAVAQPIEVYAMRIEARPFGHNAPPKLTYVGDSENPPQFGEWVLFSDTVGVHDLSRIALDADHEVDAGTYVVIEKSLPPPAKDNGSDKDDKPPPALELITLPPLDSIRHGAFGALGMSGKSLVLSWTGKPWLDNDDSDKTYDDFSVVRGSRVYLGSEKLELADAPIATEIGGETIELDGLYDGLEPGRWLIVEGERADIPDGKGDPIPGIRATELVMLAGIRQTVRAGQRTPPAPPAPPPTPLAPTNAVAGIGDTLPSNDSVAGKTVPKEMPPLDQGPQPGDTYHTVITLAGTTAEGLAGLAYRYKRDTVTIYANVAHATHGETRTETLGSGNAAQPLQTFLLRQAPLTHVSAPTPSGIASTLETRVNDVLWHEAPSLAALGPADRKYTTRTGDDDKTLVIFGNGKRGMRLPTGRENVKARYRSGIGAPGNVLARQISLLASRPLGVKDVINPMRATGGADRETAAAIRRNAPIAILALDRLLSTSDYADFARNFAGVGKASAWRAGNRVHVVIAGVDDAPIDPSSDLYANLRDALHRFGDAMVPITLTIREQLSLVVQAGVRIDPDYLWETVEPEARAAMLRAFAFEGQEIGEPLFLSHALRAIQGVRGVTSVDVDVFDAISGAELTGGGAEALGERLVNAKQRIDVGRAQIAYLPPAVPDTLILQELPS